MVEGFDGPAVVRAVKYKLVVRNWHLRREELRKKEINDEERLEPARLSADFSVGGFVFKRFRSICSKSPARNFFPSSFQFCTWLLLIVGINS